jgi:hypothetical protein
MLSNVRDKGTYDHAEGLHHSEVNGENVRHDPQQSRGPQPVRETHAQRRPDQRSVSLQAHLNINHTAISTQNIDFTKV